MDKSIIFPAPIKQAFQQIATYNHYPQIAEFIARYCDDELILSSQAAVDVARLEMLNALLKYPFWDDDSPRYDQPHEDAFQDVQMGLFKKVLMDMGQEYRVVKTV